MPRVGERTIARKREKEGSLIRMIFQMGKKRKRVYSYREDEESYNSKQKSWNPRLLVCVRMCKENRKKSSADGNGIVSEYTKQQKVKEGMGRKREVEKGRHNEWPTGDIYRLLISTARELIHYFSIRACKPSYTILQVVESHFISKSIDLLHYTFQHFVLLEYSNKVSSRRVSEWDELRSDWMRKNTQTSSMQRKKKKPDCFALAKLAEIYSQYRPIFQARAINRPLSWQRYLFQPMETHPWACLLKIQTAAVLVAFFFFSSLTRSNFILLLINLIWNPSGD